jgi:ribosomal protein S18 acetylase RimI-like enzyme
VTDILYNPVYHALQSGDARLARGTGDVLFFEETISPFVGFHHENQEGFRQLYEQLPAARPVLYATPERITEPAGWQLLHEIGGLQFVYAGKPTTIHPALPCTALGPEHVEEMVALATLTRPGPFASGTIQFGSYHGIFHQGMLVAMTGQRLHVGDYTEISAVCTHPQHLGKGYAAALVQHQVQVIISQGKQPFLHVRHDNERAIAVYERLGFVVNRPMNFYFMTRK